jgi:adenylate cyclase
MAMQTHYEVHVQQGGRWSIHAQFDSAQRDQAVEEAKQLDSHGVGSVKVIREVYDTTEGTHRDYVIYKSQGASATDGETDTTERGGGGGGGGGGWAAEDDDDYGDDDEGGFFDDDAPRPKKKAKKSGGARKSTMTTIVVKVLLITLFSICLAAICSVVAAETLGGHTIMGYRITGQREGQLVFMVFVITFLISASIMAYTFFRGESLDSREQKRYRPAKAPPKQAAPQPAKSKRAAREKENAKAQRKELDNAMAGSEDFHLADEAEAETSERLKKSLHGDGGGEDADGESQGRGVVLDADKFGDGATGVETLSPAAEKQKAYMMDFLKESLKSVGTDDKKMDNFNKFGVNLFLAGACETLAEKRNLDMKSRSKVLADSVRVMGFKKSHASTFADKYEEYLMQDPRYMQMFQAGRNAMNTHFQDPDDSAKHMQTALGEWNQPKKKEAQTGPITVLFTDIAGSTAMTQALGDAGAQEVVRAHNRIVRAALTSCNGREVKHTGDGIMASFNRVTDSVDAAIQMQRETMQHNTQNPDLPLHLKIGINAGEPIVEDNDLFGTVVQLSARIVDKAQADQIFVSEIVRGICTGKSYQFQSKGGYEMKGFEGPMTLYEVMWGNEGQQAAE